MKFGAYILLGVIYLFCFWSLLFELGYLVALIASFFIKKGKIADWLKEVISNYDKKRNTNSPRFYIAASLLIGFFSFPLAYQFRFFDVSSYNSTYNYKEWIIIAFLVIFLIDLIVKIAIKKTSDDNDSVTISKLESENKKLIEEDEKHKDDIISQHNMLIELRNKNTELSEVNSSLNYSIKVYKDRLKAAQKRIGELTKDLPSEYDESEFFSCHSPLRITMLKNEEELESPRDK